MNLLGVGIVAEVLIALGMVTNSEKCSVNESPLKFQKKYLRSNELSILILIEAEHCAFELNVSKVSQREKL